MPAIMQLAAAAVPTKKTQGRELELDAAVLNSVTSNASDWYGTVSSRNAVNFNGVTYSEYNQGTLVYNKSASQYSNIASLGTTLTNFTVETWVYVTEFTSSGGTAQFITEEYDGNNINFFIGFLTPQNGLVEGGFFKSGTGFVKAGTFVASLHTWYHFVCTYNGIDVKLYVNGSLNHSVSSGGAVPSSSGGIISLARKWDTPSDNANYMSARIPLVRIYNYALSHTDVVSNYGDLRERYAPKLGDYKNVYAFNPISFAFYQKASGTMLTYMQSFGVTGSSVNTGTGSWNTSFSGNISYDLQPRIDNNYFSEYNRVRIIQGDGTADNPDWVIFNFGAAPPYDPTDWNQLYNTEQFFGGETDTAGGTGGYNVNTGEIWGFSDQLGWILLYRLPLPGIASNSVYNKVNGNYFTLGIPSGQTTGLSTTPFHGKRSEYDTVSITHIGFAVRNI